MRTALADADSLTVWPYLEHERPLTASDCGLFGWACECLNSTPTLPPTAR
jgi:hypothetical protein